MSAFYDYHPLFKTAFQVQGPSSQVPESPVDTQQVDPLSIDGLSQQFKQTPDQLRESVMKGSNHNFLNFYRGLMPQQQQQVMQSMWGLHHGTISV